MARWGRGPNRAFGHVHNWKIKFDNFDTTLSQNEKGWYGWNVDRYWVCIRGGKIKHTTDRMINTDFDNQPFVTERRVFLALSGSPYVVEDPY